MSHQYQLINLHNEEYETESARRTLYSTLTEFREKTSDRTKSEITGINKHIKSLLNSLCSDWIVIQTSLEIVLIELIAPISIAHAVMESLRRFAKPSEIKLAVANASNNARHSSLLDSRSHIDTLAIVISWRT